MSNLLKVTLKNGTYDVYNRIDNVLLGQTGEITGEEAKGYLDSVAKAFFPRYRNDIYVKVTQDDWTPDW